ncbi:transcriptional regulator, TetR family [Aeromicrobium marinum DSM 15272]|uniref:Transcriptional regulator, TetR family n=1 Tax=Aeromicrobium marinum DSM 15272 TaxID=585531 RepID=E2SA54_9ACTN|nr:TetR/AcrR family transcriptional regulator [Aeromicrobium marinum]EFQ84128.1 transcriptional regulator, TetR family [Aeromicrobium marinum DSM 15272]
MGVDERRAARRREIIDATRALFDERGVRDAQIDDIARAVGINRAIIYRHFSGKEELFAVTLVGYLEELAAHLRATVDETASPEARLGRLVHGFLAFGIDHPAFVDCAQTLLRRRGSELMEEVGAPAMIALGSAMNACLAPVVRTLTSGAEAGDFDVPDPTLLANLFYTQGLGALNLAHLQISVRQHDRGLPVADRVSFDDLEPYMVRSAVAMAKGDARLTPP